VKFCGNPLTKAKNGADRGVSLAAGHRSANLAVHGNGTCSDCAVRFTKLNSKLSEVSKGSGKCLDCIQTMARAEANL
jgi:hypothetical protein